MPTPRKPIGRHLAEGTYNATRHGGRVCDEPEAIAAPPWMDDEERETFDDIVGRLIAARVGIVQADAFSLERATVALVNARRARTLLREEGRYTEGRSGSTVMHPAVRDERAAWDAFARSASALGLTPLDRERLDRSGSDDEEEDPLDELDRRRAEQHRAWVADADATM